MKRWTKRIMDVSFPGKNQPNKNYSWNGFWIRNLFYNFLSGKYILYYGDFI